jgi:uncharacterized protein (TIGR00369 family)
MALEAANLMVFKAAWLYDQGKPCGAEANAAKYLAGEACFDACQQAVMTHGGFGYAKEYHVERYLRESLVAGLPREPATHPVLHRRAGARAAEVVLDLPERTLPNGVRLHWREAGNPDGAPIVWIHGGSVEDSSMMVPISSRFSPTCTRFSRTSGATACRRDSSASRITPMHGRPRMSCSGSIRWACVPRSGAAPRWAVRFAVERGACARARARGRVDQRPSVRAARIERALVDGAPPARRGRPVRRLFRRQHPPAHRRRRARAAEGEAERYRETIDRLRLHSVPSFLALLDETYQRTDWLADCARIRCPVLVIAGSEDRFPSVEQSRRVAETIPGARLHVVHGGGHFPNRTHRAEVQQAIRSFLQEGYDSSARSQDMNAASQVQERFKGLLPDHLGIEMTEATQERIVAKLAVRQEVCTVGNSLHGGAIMAFADTLGAVGTIMNMPAGHRTTTIESKTNFISGAPLGSKVTGESTPLHRGRTTQVWQTRITSEAGKLVAIVTQTQMVIPA